MDDSSPLLGPRFAQVAVELLEASGFEYVVGGGWASIAYGSDVPTADFDVFMSRREGNEVARRIRQALGLEPERKIPLEVMDPKRTQRLFGSGPPFGCPERGYLPERLLVGRVKLRDLITEVGTFRVRVPAPEEFAFTKLKALYNRDLAFRALRDPEILPIIPASPTVRGNLEPYYCEKAARDLYAIGHVFAHHASVTAVLRIADMFDMREDLERAVRATHPEVRARAASVGKDEATIQWIGSST